MIIDNDVTLSGADILVRVLVEKGVSKIFAITGAGNLAIIDALAREDSIELIYAHHEQAAVMEAQGYSRVTGSLGVALVTTGGGTSNVTTGVLSAHLDSIPVLIISGNESSFHCANPNNLRAYGVQGFDSVATLKPITKNATRIESVEEVTKVAFDSIAFALDGRMGPVHIDFPMDLQRKSAAHQTLSVQTNKKSSEINTIDISGLIEDLKSAKTPVFYFGNGIRNTKSTQIAMRIVREWRIPYFVSWSAIDLFPESDPLNVGRVGIYGDRHANLLLQKSDLIVAIGTRLAIPQLGYDKGDFGRKARKWVVEIDPTECAKFNGLGWNILNYDARDVMDIMINQLVGPLDLAEWRNDCAEMKEAFPG